jgi:hypothetical protein
MAMILPSLPSGSSVVGEAASEGEVAPSPAGPAITGAGGPQAAPPGSR